VRRSPSVIFISTTLNNVSSFTSMKSQLIYSNSHHHPHKRLDLHFDFVHADRQLVHGELLLMCRPIAQVAIRITDSDYLNRQHLSMKERRSPSSWLHQHASVMPAPHLQSNSYAHPGQRHTTVTMARPTAGLITK
jgi:hypothetical protein